MRPSVVIHAHFYQPPREDPFHDELETEATAAPYHDWNQRIERECYRAVVAARIQGGDGRIERVVNTLESISFNVGPTLFEWMERHAADTYREVLAADRASCERLSGHGNAMAHPYHHVILPLASRRDKVTEVRWGVMDFRRRYGREPEGMWLPETAVDDETLDVLAQEGIRFAVLAPHQVKQPAPDGLPGRYRTSQGREIALFTYDGDLSHGIAFGSLVRDAGRWLAALRAIVEERSEGHRTRESAAVAAPTLVSAATDGETYGHHHKFAEMALARVLGGAAERGWSVENFASFLARHPPRLDVELAAPSSWSCAHGVERWRSDCGCRMDASTNPSQAWRGPLRDSLDWLASRLHEAFAAEGGQLLGGPWAAREAFGDLVAGAGADRRSEFLRRALVAGAGPASGVRALELLEMERDVLRMYTSCAWFFDDIGGIEPRQVLKYAVRAVGLSGIAGLRDELSRRLSAARSNSAAVGSGATVLAQVPAFERVGPKVAAAAHALRAMKLDPEAHLPDEFNAAVDEHGATVVERRTGRVTRFSVRLADRSPTAVVSAVRAMDGWEAEVTVPLADYPERARLAIRRALRDELLPTCLTREELSSLASGDASLRGLAALALVRAVERAATDGGVATALAVVGLYEQLEAQVPFDAQTAFWRLWQRVDAGARDRLRPLGHRLGFAAAPATGPDD